MVLLLYEAGQTSSKKMRWSDHFAFSVSVSLSLVRDSPFITEPSIRIQTNTKAESQTETNGRVRCGTLFDVLNKLSVHDWQSVAGWIIY
jgi:hypothetical protein